MKPSNPAACVTSRKRATSELTMNVWGRPAGRTQRSLPERRRLAVDPERELALEDVEPLVLAWWTCSGEPGPRGAVARSASCAAGSRPSALIVVSPPKNQKCSPSSGPRAIRCEVRRPARSWWSSTALMEDVRAVWSPRPAPTIPRVRGSFLRAVRDWRAHGWERRAPDQGDRPARAHGDCRVSSSSLSCRRGCERHRNDASCWHTLDPTRG